MKIYMAALYTNGYRHTNRYNKLNDREKRVVDNLPYTLESYFYINKEQFITAIRDRGDRVFLDSGAFSAWSKGAQINLDAYCRFIQKYADCFTVISVLDVIGSAESTWRNQQQMERHGVTPIPCFHYGEDFRWCEHYVKNYEYLALGGFGVANRKQIRQWLDRVWERCLLDGTGNPRIKIHGFAMTAFPLMERYPWHSVDSSSWVQSAAFGSIIMPDSSVISISSQSPTKKTHGQHLTTLTPIEREYVARTIEQNGFDLGRLSDIYESRAAYNLWSFRQMNKRINSVQERSRLIAQQELF